MEIRVRPFSEGGELILGPFTRSAATGVAAVRLGGRLIGWGMNPEHGEMARRRLAAVREELKVTF